MALDAVLSFEKATVTANVDAYSYRDALSELFQLDVEFLSDESSLDLSEILGAGAKLELRASDLVQAIQGVVNEAEQLTSIPEGASRYRVRIVPLEWLATQRRDSRIFQKKTVPDIVQEVYSLFGGGPAKKLGGSYDSVEYLVQYQEEDHTFGKRLLAELGIGFYFDHANGSRMTVFDDSTTDLGGSLKAPFRAQRTGEERYVPHVSSAAATTRLTPGKVSLTDFDHAKPALDLALNHPAKAPLAREKALEVFAHDIGTYKVSGHGKSIAKQMLEELRAANHEIEIVANFPCAAGSEITLAEHPRDDMNTKYLVTASTVVVRFGETAGSRLRVIPKTTPFRPRQIAKPRIHGTQTAIVVGEKGEEIDTDEQGRVKVAFHWDRQRTPDGAPTRWIRVSQAWAGPDRGLFNLPRVGDEVVVTFLDGDPDEPLVIGRVHNGTAPPPLKLPDQKTRSIWKTRSSPNGQGSNEIMMEDKVGSELVSIKSQLDMKLHAERHADISIGKNATETIGANHTQEVKGNQDATIHGNQSTTVLGDCSLTVSGSLGEKSASHSIKSGPISLDGTDIGVNGSAQIAQTAPMIFLTGDASIVATAPEVNVGGTSQATVTSPVTTINGDGVAVLKSGAMVVVDGTTVSISGAAVVTISAGAAITVSAPTVNVTGSGTVNVGGGTANITGGKVNISGGEVAIN